MKSYNLICSFVLSALLLGSCGHSSKDKNATLNEKKVALQQLIKQKNSIEESIRNLKKEIALLDSNEANNMNAKLVSISAVLVQPFNHYIDLRGRIDAENISYITPRGMGGQVKSIYIKEGDAVKRGQLVLKLDDAIYRQSLIAARQQLESIKTQLVMAKSLYERQSNLWEKGIGTEVQLMSARTTMETLQNQLKAAQEQVNVVAEQLNTTNVYSDVEGIAEVVMVKVGELFSGMGQIKIVNNSNLKVVANVPENYLTKVKKGAPVVIQIPEANQTINSSLFLVGQTIEATQRGFVAEAKIPSDGVLKPNQSVVMKILDYASQNAVVIPINTVQSDESNKYVYVLQKLSNGKEVATRKTVVLGEIYGEQVEIKSGLSGGEQLITAGYQTLYEGQVITTTAN